MATNNSKQLVRRDRPTQQETVKQMIDFGKRHAFTIFVIVAGVITLLALQANGIAQSSNEFTFDDTLQTIVGLYNLAIMAYPAYLAITRRQQTVSRLIIIGISVVFTFFVLAVWVRLVDMLINAGSVWSIPFIGSIVLPLLALAAHGYAAILLSYVPETAPRDRQDLTDLDEDLRSAKRKEARATVEHDAAQNLLEPDVKRLSDLTRERDQRVKEREAADLAVQELPASVTLNQQTEDLKALSANIAIVQQHVSDDKSDRGAKSQLAKLGTMERELRASIADLRTDIEASPEAAAAHAAKQAEVEASMHTKDAYEKMQLSEQRVKEAYGKLLQATEERTLLEEDRQHATDHQTATHTEERANWRDSVFGPVTCLVIAIALYPVWYGWVIAT